MTTHHPFGQTEVGVTEHPEAVPAPPAWPPATSSQAPAYQQAPPSPQAPQYPPYAQAPQYPQAQQPAPSPQHAAGRRRASGRPQTAGQPPVAERPAAGQEQAAGRQKAKGRQKAVKPQKPVEPVDLPPPTYGAVTPYDQPLPTHGGFLVAYPERLGGGSSNGGSAGGARPSVPAVWPVALFTLVFGIFGAISAQRRSARAKAGGGRAAPYWLTFAGVYAVVVAAVVVAIIRIGVPTYLAIREGAVVKVLQENLVTDGRLATTAKITATRAQCTAEGERSDDGIRPYACVLTLTDGRTGMLHVTADSSGTWALAPTP